MKFDEKRWRYLAENKPGELHSYIPQSSIIELFDEIERLEREIVKCKEANKDVQNRLDDYRQDYAKVVNDLCPTDERHCGCVPILRRENRLISEELADAKDKLQDAQLKPKAVYTVTMYRYGNREWHSYVLGAFSSNDIAREWAAKEEEYRGGQYKAEIIRWGIDSPTDFLKGEL